MNPIMSGLRPTGKGYTNIQKRIISGLTSQQAVKTWTTIYFLVWLLVMTTFGPDQLKDYLPMIKKEIHGEKENLLSAVKWVIGFALFVTIKKRIPFGLDDLKI